MPAVAHINRIGTALPPNEVYQTFMDWAGAQLSERRDQALFRRMAGRSGIARRWSVLPRTAEGGSPVDFGGFYHGPFPSTAVRMAAYAEAAPPLAEAAVAELGPLGEITHLVVASCTGFTAPGIDQVLQGRLGLAGSVERTLVGFMGCYAAIAALRVAHHIVRSDAAARVLVVNIELPTLHLQPDTTVEPILAQLLWSDGASAALVTAEPVGIAIERVFAATLPHSEGLITWAIGDTGFNMALSGDVPGRIAHAIVNDRALQAAVGDVAGVDGWAVHAGGRSVLDAVESGFALAPDALRHSRAVLAECGNMSSPTIMFVLARILAEGVPTDGVALAFGPGLAAEGFRFGRPRG